MENDIPRRNRIDRMIPAELAIREAVHEVEEAGAHPLLTEAVNLLSLAKDKVSDWHDGHTTAERAIMALDKAVELAGVPEHCQDDEWRRQYDEVCATLKELRGEKDTPVPEDGRTLGKQDIVTDR